MRALRERLPEARVIVLTSFGDDDKLLPALRAGAAGYLLKDVEPQELVARDPRRPRRRGAARPGRRGPARRGARADGERRPARPPHAARARGAGADRPRPANKLIALELGVAEKTVKTHVCHVLGKLGVTDRTQAALYAVRARARRTAAVQDQLPLAVATARAIAVALEHEEDALTSARRASDHG